MRFAVTVDTDVIKARIKDTVASVEQRAAVKLIERREQKVKDLRRKANKLNRKTIDRKVRVLAG